MEPGQENRESALATQVQELQAQLRYARQEHHARLKNAYQLLAGLLQMLIGERSLIPAQEVRALNHTLRVMHLVAFLQGGEHTPEGLVRLQPLLAGLRSLLHEFCSSLSWRQEDEDENLWLTGNQATALGIALQQWSRLAATPQDIPFSIEVALGFDALAVVAYPLAPSVTLEGSQSDSYELLETLIRFDLKGTCSYTIEPDGELRATLTLSRDVFQTAPLMRADNRDRGETPFIPEAP